MFLKLIRFCIASRRGRDRECLIKAGNASLTRSDLDALLIRYDLALPPSENSATVIYLKAQQFEVEPDFHLDWRDLSDGDPAAVIIASMTRNIVGLLVIIRHLDRPVDADQATNESHS